MKICSRCVMDTSDAEIVFDEAGVCNHCHKFDNVQSRQLFSDASGEQRLQKIIGQIKKDGSGKDYDCIIGLSGGVDSSYLAVKVKDLACAHWLCMWTPAGIANLQSVILKRL